MTYTVTTLDDAKVLCQEIALFADAVRGVGCMIDNAAPTYHEMPYLAICLRALGEGIGIRADSLIAGGEALGNVAAWWLLPPELQQYKQAEASTSPANTQGGAA